jgi:mono/diheme cytochrome c family protein
LKLSARRLLALGTGAAAALAAGAAAAEGGGPGPGAAAGRVLYQTYCASCHGAGGKGDGPVAPILMTPPADLTTLSERYGTPLRRKEVAAFIDGRRDVAAHGPREMPVWGERFVEESLDAPNPERQAAEAIDRIIDYLETLQRFESAAR